MANWKHKDVWKHDGNSFMVEVSRHEVAVDDSGCYDSEGPNRWCIYAYVYPKHPAFALFDSSKGMFDQPSFGMHAGNSYFRTWRKDDGSITSYQVGCDYNHLDDWEYTRMPTKDEAASVFDDAADVIVWLTHMEQDAHV